MCGIVGAIAQRDVAHILLEGLQRLEYRGYDSAGMAIIGSNSASIQCIRVTGKVAQLAESLQKQLLPGCLGIAHTRWATHGPPTQENAHPHCSENAIAVVHNGIIENHEFLREKLTALGYQFQSETDTEVIAHLIHHHAKEQTNLLTAIQKTTAELSGAYALGIVAAHDPHTLYATRRGSPLVIGVGIGERFIASDPLALTPVTQKFIYLEEGDLAEIKINQITIYDEKKKKANRSVHTTKADYGTVSKGQYRHFMQKEIFEQAQAITDTLDGRLIHSRLSTQIFGYRAETLLRDIERIQIVACGTSYHAALVARYWLEAWAHIPTQVEIASEHRYRQGVVEPHCLFVTLSQSGETADTLAALRQAKSMGYCATLGICNVPDSSLAREVDLIFLTRAGTEIGVAATKTFTTQLTALLLLTLLFCQQKKVAEKELDQFAQQLKQLPKTIQKALALDSKIQTLSHRFVDKQHALFLGRGAQFPIALEGALKLKEISYMHAEAYPAGELKHGPLALVDKGMPVIVVAPKDHLIEKLESNMQEVLARGGELYVFIDETIAWQPKNSTVTLIKMPATHGVTDPIVYTIPLQLLAYHIAVLKGTDVDQPRNLAKSVTVE